MIKNGKKRKRAIAAFFLALLLVQNFYPATVYALTSGPSQPEMQKFSPAGVSDMVDLFSGDFKYDIPLMDVGGYPVNLSYHSGAGIEDEASWVGFGWSLNPGSMNRDVRGLPDDFTGDDHTNDASRDPQDAIRTIQYQKEFDKVGGELIFPTTVFGFNVGLPSLKVGVYKDNYYGIGANVGASVDFDVFKSSGMSLSAGLDVTSDNRQGVTVSPSFQLSSGSEMGYENNSLGLSGGFHYNTRSGLESVNLGQTFSAGANFDGGDGDAAIQSASATFGFASFLKTFHHSYTPSFGTNTTTNSATFNFDGGGTVYGFYVGGGGQGYLTKVTNAEPHSSLPAYGVLHYAAGKANPAPLLDFNREKDLTFLPGMPAIPVPVSTEDYFVATSQAGAQQFRPVYNGNYIVYDRPFTQNSTATTAGLSLGFGEVFQAGDQLQLQSTNGSTHKWAQTSFETSVAAPTTGDPTFENVYFKQAGEHTETDPYYYGGMQADKTQKIQINNVSVNPDAGSTWIFGDGSSAAIGGPIMHKRRDVRTATFSYLTAAQAMSYGLEKQINSAPALPANSNQGFSIPRVDDITKVTDPVKMVRKPHHISEITVTDKDGKRMIYGIPVYNTDKEEVSMSLKAPAAGQAMADARRTGLISYTPGVDNSESNRNGRLNIYDRKVTPPYVTSWLLTGILSPDYVDLGGDGITDDDLGTAVKFSYSKSNPQQDYMWRAPFNKGGNTYANYNEGHLIDPQDDKGSYVFGTKELWYLNTIKSKTMIALFYTSARTDGFGAASEDGTGLGGVPLQELDSIRLFSLADYNKNPANAVPIKVAHFQYDYSLVPGIPNSSNGGGKLTLRKLWFTFGSSSRGSTNPYSFTYNTQPVNTATSASNFPTSTYSGEPGDSYVERETDRWGTYRQSFFTTASHKFINSEFPYASQVYDDETYDQGLLSDRFAGKWQLSSITTPTGGIITVNYEADDYSYVQDQKAMMMCQVIGVGSDMNGAPYIPSRSGLSSKYSNLLFVSVPRAPATISSTDFVNAYLTGADGQHIGNIFFKIKANMDNKNNDFDYVYGYAAIDYSKMAEIAPTDPSDRHVWAIPLLTVNDYNPVAIQAWQTLQTDMPQFAYPNYDNSDASSVGQDVSAAVRSIVQSFANLRELYEPFYTIAAASKYADVIDPDYSLVRLNFPGSVVPTNVNYKPVYGKSGGGARVHSLELNDAWSSMSGLGKSVSYGISYDYTTKDDQGNMISSGVASYEPEIGNEENPLRQPLPYTDKVEWGQDKYHFMETPFGEAYFPAPSVGYSQVTATSYGVDPTDPSLAHQFGTGYTISSFYTARDFPTQTDYTPLETDQYEYDLSLLLFGAKYTNRAVTSQGFKVILNDMHGKQKMTQTYDQNNALVSSTEYIYNVTDANAQRKTLNNTVLAMCSDGKIPPAGTLVATDIDMITDLRESKTTGSGTSVGAHVGFFWAVWAIPYVGVSYSANASVETYNSAAVVKVIHQYGLLKEVKTTQLGSTLTADNLLWDAQTGEVLLTRNQNEFNDYTYALNYPAFRGYGGMSSAYKNLRDVFSGFSTNASGEVPVGLLPYLSAGDELVDIDQNMNIHGWLIAPGDNTLRFIDQTGNFINVSSGTFMVVRSGRRNLLGASAGSVVTMQNPLVQTADGYILQANVNQQVLDSKAVTYKDEWGVPVPNFLSPSVTPASTYSFLSFNVDGGGTTPEYNINQNGIVSCNSSVVEAGRVQDATNPTGPLDAIRGYMNFQIPSPDIGNGYILKDVQLVLLPIPGETTTATDGNNNAYIRRVISGTPCTIGSTSPNSAGVTWATQYMTTNNNQVLINGATAVFGQPYKIDVTALYNDWLAASDAAVPEFVLQLAMADETDASTVQLNFMGLPDDGVPTTTNSSYLEFDYAATASVCTPPVRQIFNPYYNGVKGNWRPYYNYAYQVNRASAPGNPGLNGGTNIRNSGYYSTYSPFWMFADGAMSQLAPVAGQPGSVADPRWVWATQSIYYDQKGNEIENVDPLGRYSSVLFGYQQSLATAVAVNARHNEIAYDGFEDYYFNLPTTLGPCPLPRQLDMGLTLNGGIYSDANGNYIVSGFSHTGNYSLALRDLTISSGVGNAAPPSAQWVNYDLAGHATLVANEEASGFSPVYGKKYLLSMWVKDEDSSTNIITGMNVAINTVNQDLSSVVCPVVEKWKQLNLTFTAGDVFTLHLTGSGNGGIYVDDIRILPFDAEMKTFVYDDQSLRLMGQLDENNFGVLYEYDDEGTPIRVKKETERGVMTVKENRQSLKTQQ